MSPPSALHKCWGLLRATGAAAAGLEASVAPERTDLAAETRCSDMVACMVL